MRGGCFLECGRYRARSVAESVTAARAAGSHLAIWLASIAFQSKIKSEIKNPEVASQCNGETWAATSGGPLSHEHRFEEVLNEKLVLASRSPRRAEILKAIGWPFEIAAADIDESRFEFEAVVPYVRRMAQTKAETVAKNLSTGLVLGADTVVLVDEKILGQPRDAEDAREMLKLLSGRWHEVLTAVVLLRAGANRSLIDHEKTRVRFAEMSAAEIDWYVETGEPMDKAGAYAVQGGAFLHRRIQATISTS